MKTRKRKRLGPQIPMSAMSDIAMLLLIFFVVTTQFLVQRAIQAELPAVTSEKDEASEDLVTVLLESEIVYLDDERISLDELSYYLSLKLADKVEVQERAVILDARDDVSTQRFVDACSAIELAGGIPTIMKVED